MKNGFIKILLVVVLVCAMATPAMAEKVLRWASQGTPDLRSPFGQ
jgi:hypothetical protein